MTNQLINVRERWRWHAWGRGRLRRRWRDARRWIWGWWHARRRRRHAGRLDRRPPPLAPDPGQARLQSRLGLPARLWLGAAAAAATVGAGLAYSSYDPYYGGYGYYDDGAYAEQSDPIAECARRFKTYDPASQTYIVSKGVRASCP